MIESQPGLWEVPSWLCSPGKGTVQKPAEGQSQSPLYKDFLWLCKDPEAGTCLTHWRNSEEI